MVLSSSSKMQGRNPWHFVRKTIKLCLPSRRFPRTKPEKQSNFVNKKQTLWTVFFLREETCRPCQLIFESMFWSNCFLCCVRPISVRAPIIADRPLIFPVAFPAENFCLAAIQRYRLSVLMATDRLTIATDCEHNRKCRENRERLILISNF